MLASLAACSNENDGDLKNWMASEESRLKGKIGKLPVAKSFNPTPYNASADPFVVKEKLSLKNLLKDKYAPNTNRQKEELEDFSLESLRMVGTVVNDGKFYAMIRDNKKMIYYISVGGHMGKNYGEVTHVSEGEILIDERLKVNDEWVVKPARIFLFEGMDK